MNTLVSDASAPQPSGHSGDLDPMGRMLVIRGGRPLTGRVEVKGAKNLATKAMVAALLPGLGAVAADAADALAVAICHAHLRQAHARLREGAR